MECLQLIPEFENLKNLTLPEYLLQRAKQWAEAQNGNKEYIIDGVSGASRGFSTFPDQSKRIASGLYKLGLRKGNMVIFMTSDLVNIPIFLTGVWMANGVLRASYPEEDEATLVSRIEESRASYIYCDESKASFCISLAKKITWLLHVIVNGKYDGCISFESLVEDAGDEIPVPQLHPNDPSIIFSTSGTTGRVKGAVHTHSSLLLCIEAHARFEPFRADKPNLITSKPTYISGVVFAFSVFVYGKTFLTIQKLTKANFLSAIEKFKPGLVMGVPIELFNLMNESKDSNDLSSIDIVCAGGAPASQAMCDSFKQLPNLKYIINTYGTTEISPISINVVFRHDNVDAQEYESFTEHNIVPEDMVQIQDEDGGVIGPNQNGQICVKSIYMFNGYYKNEKATKEAFRNGWYLTGDIGYLDDLGSLHFVGRAKEMCMYDGMHISPLDLEDVINEHPGVMECCVVGVPDPNSDSEFPRAFVKLKNGYTCSEENISEFANSKLPDYKRLRGGVFFLPELPKGITGKVSRKTLSEFNPNK